MDLRHVVKRLLPPIAYEAIGRSLSRRALARYLHNGSIPWSSGYQIYKRQVITEALADRALLERFHLGEPLPPGYGVGVDERCVEYPWFLSNLEGKREILLDAGSTLNYDYILDHPLFARNTVHILTLAPEENCFWRKGISYLFADLREIPVRDAYYDTIVCLSTLEHVGCDNTLYTKDRSCRENRPDEFLLAMKEFFRVLKAGGTLLVTVPFGVYRHFGTFQQFDRRLLSLAVEAFGPAEEATQTFYRYTAQGWNLASVEECADCAYVEWITAPPDQWPRRLPVEPDLAAAARAVACVRLIIRMSIAGFWRDGFCHAHRHRASLKGPPLWH